MIPRGLDIKIQHHFSSIFKKLFLKTSFNPQADFVNTFNDILLPFYLTHTILKLIPGSRYIFSRNLRYSNLCMYCKFEQGNVNRYNYFFIQFSSKCPQLKIGTKRLTEKSIRKKQIQICINCSLQFIFFIYKT